METTDNLPVSFHGGGKLKQGTSSHDLPYTHFPPIIASWLLIKLAEVSHDLMTIGNGTTFPLWSVTTPGRTARRRKQEDQARSKTKHGEKCSSHQLTFYRWPSSPSKLVLKLSTLYAVSRQPSSSNNCPSLFVAFATATQLPYQVPRIHLDTDSFVISVDTFTSITLGNHHDQFEDLKMHDDTEEEGIKGGLYIKGTGTIKFHTGNDEGVVHLIKIPNSRYIPDLKVCLLLPHH
jgi:hypothetical protein